MMTIHYWDALRLQKTATEPSSLVTLSAKNRLANVLVRLKRFEAGINLSQSMPLLFWKTTNTIEVLSHMQ